MNKRLENFENMKNHPWLCRIYRKLKASELEIARGFLSKNSDMDKGSFELALNRMFLDGEKPKNWKEIQELLTCANSAL